MICFGQSRINRSKILQRERWRTSSALHLPWEGGKDEPAGEDSVAEVDLGEFSCNSRGNLGSSKETSSGLRKYSYLSHSRDEGLTPPESCRIAGTANRRAIMISLKRKIFRQSSLSELDIRAVE